MDVYEYFGQKEREAAECSLSPERDFREMVAEESGSNGKRGQVLGNFFLTERAFLAVHEVVVVLNNHTTREEYAYYLIIDGEEIWGYERDPTHDPAVHWHYQGGTAQESERVSFKEAAGRAWEEVTAREAF